MDPVAGWYDDPTGRHEHRYWDGGQWTDRVRDQGAESTDPVAGGPASDEPADTAPGEAGPADPEPDERAGATGAGDWAMPGSSSSSAAGGPATGGPGPSAPGGPGAAAPAAGGDELPPAGWYPDPSTRGQQRYWDGNQWTEHTHQASGTGGQGYASSGYGGAASGGYGAGGHGEVKTWLIPSILATVFCCLPLGIVGIVYASRANSRLGEGNVAAAREAAEKARMWTLISVGAGVVIGIVYAIVFAAGIAGSGMF